MKRGKVGFRYSKKLKKKYVDPILIRRQTFLALGIKD
jgi:hypothetical protein